MTIRHIIVFSRSSEDHERFQKFLLENEAEYTYIRSYIRADGTMKDIGVIYACATEKAEFKLRLMFETKDYIV